jgi:hypothetical protein
MDRNKLYVATASPPRSVACEPRDGRAQNMKKAVNAFDTEGMNAPEEIRRLCVKVANQGGKDLWWNAMAAATELVNACQRECRAEVERVANRRAVESRARRRT